MIHISTWCMYRLNVLLMQILNAFSYQESSKAEEFAPYTFDKQAKTLISVPSSVQTIHRFALGTFDKSESNEIRVIDFDEESFGFFPKTVATNLLPVDHLLDFYSTKNITNLLVSYKDLSGKGSTVGVLTINLDSVGNPEDNKPENKLGRNFEIIRRLSVDPYSSSELTRFSVITRDRLYIFRNFQEEFTYKVVKEVTDKYSLSFFCGAFDPHHRDLFALSSDNFFEILDLRQEGVKRVNVKSVPFHKGTILDLSFNPNLPNEISTTGEDTLVLFWDLRNTQRPVSSFESGHGHWVKRLCYNSFHDQLLVSCGASGSFLHRRQERLDNISEKRSLCQDICWSYDDAWFYGCLLNRELKVEMVPKSLKNSLLS